MRGNGQEGQKGITPVSFALMVAARGGEGLTALHAVP